jgi:hypothetical protein
MLSRRSTLALALLSGLLAPAAAHAAKKGSGTSGSAVVQARRLMAEGNYEEACPKLAQAQLQSPAPTTALALATCYEKQGKLATAWATFNAAALGAEASEKKKVAEEAHRAAAELEPKLSHVTIKPPPDTSGTEVRVDNEPVSDSDLGVAVARDGGGHDIEVSAPGKKTWNKHIDLETGGQNIEVDVPRLADDRPGAGAGGVTAAGSDGSNAAPADSNSEPSSGQGQRIAGIAIAGVGIVALGVGAFAGLHASSTYNDARAACGSSSPCPPDSNGSTLRDSASTWASVSTVSFAAGGVALVGGALVLFTAPHGASGGNATVGIGPAGASAGNATVGIGPATRGTGLSVVGRF